MTHVEKLQNKRHKHFLILDFHKILIVQAEAWLKEQAQKEGWTKATKLQSRSMSNGLVAIFSNNNAITMIEVSIFV